ncbi:prostaglandin D2 synthase a [Trichomycterus rosablanca]|uniref:prostaglandin D2 synthase a n=1 Tax=Trichomycterus rosablanca TaxID=2290929 RepID=UPI002F35117D
MKITLVTISMAVFLTGIHADVQPQKNFDLKKFAGKWYRVGLAYDSPSFARYRKKLTVCMGLVEPTETGDVIMTVWKTKSSTCQKEVFRYEKTTSPGMFTYFSTRHNKVKDITVVETNYTEYALIFKYKKFNKEYSQVSLYGRTQKLRPELLEKFKRYARQQGFSEESIITPALADSCPTGGH